MTRLWDRGESLDRFVLNYTAGEDHALDDRLVAYDVRASRAHAAMLHACGYLSAEDFAALDGALAAIGAAHARGEWQVSLEEEDCHTAIENRLAASVGEAGLRIHLGRSRNDQVLAALRLWLKDALDALAGDADAVAAALRDLAARDGHLAMPGYTHLQRAMPSTVALWAEAFASEVEDDAEGLRAARRRADKNPLGSAAGYGVPVLDARSRADDARVSGFARDARAGDRGAALAGQGGSLRALRSRVARAGSGKARRRSLSLRHRRVRVRAYCPTSSPPGLRCFPRSGTRICSSLARGRTAEAFAALHEVLDITAKMPSGYHRDLQLIKKPLFRGFDSVSATAQDVRARDPRHPLRRRAPERSHGSIAGRGGTRVPAGAGRGDLVSGGVSAGAFRRPSSCRQLVFDQSGFLPPTLPRGRQQNPACLELAE